MIFDIEGVDPRFECHFQVMYTKGPSRIAKCCIHFTAKTLVKILPFPGNQHFYDDDSDIGSVFKKSYAL